LSALLYVIWNRSEKFRGAIEGIGEVIKGLGKSLKEFVLDKIKALLSGITGLGSALLKFFRGDWKGAWEEGKKAVGDLTKLMPNNLINAGISNVSQDAKQNYAVGYAKGALAVQEHTGIGLFGGGMHGMFAQLIDNKTSNADRVSENPTGSGSNASSGGNTGINSGGSGGGSKIITMNLNFKQTFTGGDVKTIAQQVVA
jgi:hypothetical protein